MKTGSKLLPPLLWTGQDRCYDTGGREIACDGSGQDGEFRVGAPWPSPRFSVKEETVHDLLTGLVWTRSVNPLSFPVTWPEAIAQVARFNDERLFGFADWRLPDRRELRSLMSLQARKPCLPEGHPFSDIFLGWYWTSTTAVIHPAYAWCIHLEGARMFYSRKDQNTFVLPVRGPSNGLLPRTGQRRCYDVRGKEIPCHGSGQDGERRNGVAWPDLRFALTGETARDRLTGLTWDLHGDAAGGPVTWQEALKTVRHLNEQAWLNISSWRLPSINELESLVDCAAHSPALPSGHPFSGLRDGYWSSTTSYFETDWAWVLYLDKGACGVGHKPGRTFYVWPVCGDVIPG